MTATGAADSIAFEPLAAFVAALFRAQGGGRADGLLVADSLVQADPWGHRSHGVLRAPWYLEPRRAGVHLALMVRTVWPSAYLYSVGAPEYKRFAAQCPAYGFPCQRFAAALASVSA